MNTSTYRHAASRSEIIRRLRDVADGEILGSSCGDLTIERKGALGIMLSSGLLRRIAELLEQ